ncbi:hypothetical protein KIN20_033935 [Parelaphostrongylus tenuis]|uniref:Galactosylgalactosylxylosylprotein 3-beta-glucuronosyltransferase n=1 Tax=Parelaphostrongylus tenuis TaxID=148309 RepID=A0AAD5WJB8_PARTN|nr:hypothetical protein KIN20_033935 [Parelaphostrongylus tenuis]
MAAFAVNITRITSHPSAAFSFDVARGEQESHFLSGLGLSRSDLEPKADMCTKVGTCPRAVDSIMGERKGQNFYYPPDFDYKKHKSLNKYHGTHALRERAKKISQGILIIRFEMPFNIWCLGCNNHVGWCHLCDNYFVIRTDPKNFDYELVEGCSRQEKRFEPSEIDQIDTSDSDFSHKLAADAMFKTEHREEDKNKATSDETRMDKIEWIQERLRDDFAANQALRAQFRKEKKELNEKRAYDDDLRARCSLSIPLEPEDPNDRKVAGMLARFRTIKSQDELEEERRREAAARRIFPSTSSSEAPSPKIIDQLKKTIKRDRDRQINDNFNFGLTPKKSSLTLGVIRKDVKEEAEYIEDISPNTSSNIKNETKTTVTSGLVADYDSSGSD